MIEHRLYTSKREEFHNGRVGETNLTSTSEEVQSKINSHDVFVQFHKTVLFFFKYLKKIFRRVTDDLINLVSVRIGVFYQALMIHRTK